MKKLFTIKLQFLFILEFLSLTLFSCQEFMTGSSLANQLQEEIDIANAPYIEFELQKGNGGSVSPVGKQHVKCKTEFTISYEKDNDYQFIEWQILIDNKILSDNEAAQLVSFSDKDKELTTIKFLAEVNGQLVIKPLCYERPVILGKTPTETPEGSYRDAKISILFSKAIDQNSIFYSNINELPSGATPKFVDDNPSKEIYGYTLNGNTFFKNIEIKNIDTQENLLECYGAPYLDSATRLCIPVIKDKEPKGGSQILVSISKNMYSTIDGKSVSLAKNEIWNYVVNTKIDSDVPLFESIELKKYDYDSEPLKTLTHYELDGTFSKQLIKDLYLNKNYLGLIIKCKDLGSGLNSAAIKMQRLYDYNFASVSNLSVSELPLPLTYTSGKNNATIYKGSGDETIPFDVNLKDVENGIYKVWFKITDVNGNSIESINDTALPDNSMKYFYILKTDTAVDLTTIKTIPQNESVKIQLTDNYSYLFKKISLTYRNTTVSGSPEKTMTIDVDSTTEGLFNLTDLQDGCIYTITANFYDIFDNPSPKIETRQVMTAPAAPSVTKAGVYTGPTIAYECQKFYQDGEYFNINEVTDYYGRGVELKAPQNVSGYPLKYKVYDGDKVLQENITSTEFNLAYSDTEGKKEYTMASYLIIGGEVIEGPKSKPFVYHERNVDGIFIDTVYSSENRFGVVGGFIVSNSNTKAGTDHRFNYGRWERYLTRNGTVYSDWESEGDNFKSGPLVHTENNYTFYYRRDICITSSKDRSYVFRMKKTEADNDANDVLFGLTFKKNYADRNVQFLWDGYTVK